MTAPSIARSRRNPFADFSPVILPGALALSGCTSEHSAEPGKGSAASTSSRHKEVGEASWYGPGFHGKETANGETFDQKKMTAAHPSLPMGTQAEVTNLENGKKSKSRSMTGDLMWKIGPSIFPAPPLKSWVWKRTASLRLRLKPNPTGRRAPTISRARQNRKSTVPPGLQFVF